MVCHSLHAHAIALRVVDMIIDAHHHFWTVGNGRYPWLEAKGQRRFFGDPSPIQRDYTHERFRDDWSVLPITGSVHIQVGAAPGLEVAETEWVDGEFARSGMPGAIVAFADMTSPLLGSLIDRHAAASPLLRGIRHIVSRHAAEDGPRDGATLIGDERFVDGLRFLAARGLSFDLQLTASLLPQATEVFGLIPDLRVALCHAGSPWDRDAASLRRWKRDLAGFAQLPNAVCKLSGLGMFDHDWTTASLSPIVDGVLEGFGAKRTMWGSNFPVDKLYRSYRELHEAMTTLLPSPMHAAVFGETATYFYRPSVRVDSRGLAPDQGADETSDLGR